MAYSRLSNYTFLEARQIGNSVWEELDASEQIFHANTAQQKIKNFAENILSSTDWVIDAAGGADAIGGSWFFQSGTTVQREAYALTLSVGSRGIWYDTDHGTAYFWDGSAFR